MSSNSIEILSLDSPIFAELKQQINSEIQRVLMQADLGNFQGGEISAKINIVLYPDYVDDYDFKRPGIDYQVVTNLRKQYKQTGGFHPQYEELRAIDGVYGLVHIEDAQMDFLD